jgi:hypothetical protein
LTIIIIYVADDAGGVSDGAVDIDALLTFIKSNGVFPHPGESHVSFVLTEDHLLVIFALEREVGVLHGLLDYVMVVAERAVEGDVIFAEAESRVYGGNNGKKNCNLPHGTFFEESGETADGVLEENADESYYHKEQYRKVDEIFDGSDEVFHGFQVFYKFS